MLKELLKEISSWSDLKESLNRVDPAKAGLLFEEFAKLYFLLEPTIKDDFKNVWLYRELPIAVRQRLGMGSIEHGVDLVLEDYDGKLTVVQCKYRVNESASLSWSKDKISNLHGFGQKADRLAVFSNASQIDEVSRTINDQFSFFSIETLLKIRQETFASMGLFLSGKAIVKPKVFSPLPHQKDAIDSVQSYFVTKERGQIIMPCGSGKTLTSLWIKEALGAKHTLVLVPSLALLKQTKEVWAGQKRHNYRYICVCSESDIDQGSDSTVAHVYEIGGNVTTQPEVIRDFLTNHSELVIFSTYQSLPSIQQAIKEIPDYKFDVVICDEAHKTAGSASKRFAFIHDNQKIPAKKRLYMTATPRVLSVAAKHLLGEDMALVADMSDEKVFGSEAYRMSFKRAIDRDILVDYRIIAVGVTDEELQGHLKNRSFVEDGTISIDEIANNYALSKIMKKYRTNHAITFHSSVSGAKKFSERHQLLEGQLYTRYVSGDQSSSYRAKVLEEFRHSAGGVVSNARCLTEGVDVPSIDLVYFCDPKRSKVDIVQAAGRALRKSEGKNLGYIVVPIFHNNEEDLESVIDSGAFKNLVQVVRALADQDERLQDEINSIAIAKGKRRLARLDVLIGDTTEQMVKLINFEENLRSALFDQIIEQNRVTWDVRFEELKEFRRIYPDRWPKKEGELSEIELILGSWCGIQRKALTEQTLLPRRKELLDSIDFPWDKLAYNWMEAYEALRAFLEAKGRWPRLGVNKSDQELFLKAWCDRQLDAYREHKLSEEYIDLLNDIEFDWAGSRGLKNRWLKHYGYAREYLQQKGVGWIEGNAEYPPNNKLGSWASNQRQMYRRGELPKERVALLNQIGFQWHGDDLWQIQYNNLLNFRKDFSDRWPKQLEEYPKGNRLGSWVSAQAERYRKGLLGNVQKEKLEQINFDPSKKLSRNSRYSWDENYQRYSDFLKNGKTQNSKHVQLWAVIQRKKFRSNSLTEDQVRKLDNIGFQWNVAEDNWAMQYKRLKEYRKQNPDAWPSKRIDGKNDLGKWVWRQIDKHRKNKLDDDQIKLLRKIDFPIDQTVYDRKWNIQFDYLLEFLRINGNRWPRQDEEFPQKNTLGNWLNRQRTRFSKGVLEADKIQKLRTLGYRLELEKNSANTNIELLRKYRKQFPNRWPKTGESFENHKLGRWVQRQQYRYQSGKMKQRMIDSLTSIGFPFSQN